MKSDFPEGIADLLTKAPTTKKEKQVKTTTTTKETTVPTTTPVNDSLDELINGALVAIGNEIVAGIAHEEALRSACFAVHTATEAGVSVRALEKASVEVIGKKISKTTIARYAKVGEALVAKPELVASEVLSAIYADENAKTKATKEAKASKASAESDEAIAEGDDEVVDSIPVDLEFIVDALVDAPIQGLKSVSAHLFLTESDDYEVCLAVAQGALLAGATLSGDDEVSEALRVLAEAVAKIAKQ